MLCRRSWRKWRRSKQFVGVTKSLCRRQRSQFPMAHPAVAAIIPGARSVAEVEENVRLLSLPIPNDFWEELRLLKSRHHPGAGAVQHRSAPSDHLQRPNE